MNRILRISILLNVALAVAAGLVFRKPANPDGPAEEVATFVPTLTEAALDNLAASNAPTGVVFTTNAFRWQSLESTNYDEFVTRLRDVDCPERTVRDILFADAERRYANAQAAQPEKLPFWLAGRALAEANRRAETNRSAAQAAVVADLKRLFGVDWSPDDGEMRDVKVQALSRMIVGPVSDEEHERVWRWLLATVRQQQSFRHDRQSILLESDLTAWQSIAADRKLQLGQILGPVAFEEFQARSSLLEEMFNSKLLHVEDLDVTANELRSLSLTKARQVGWLDELFEQNRSGDDKTDRTAAYFASLKDVLSPEHFEEFMRVQDENYRDILSATRDNNLPRNAAQKVYEVRQLAQAEYLRLHAEAKAPETAAAVAALQVTTADSIRKILGTETFHKFTMRNGQWVTNFSKL